MQKQKIKTFTVTREDDMETAVAQVEDAANEWLENNPDYTIVTMTAAQSTSPETELSYAKHTATVAMVVTYESSELKPIACPPMIDVMPRVLDMSNY